MYVDVPEKSRWLSRGFVGSVVAAVCGVAVVAGVPDLPQYLGFESQAVLVDWVLKLSGLAGAVTGAYGRLKAKHTLK